MKIQWSEQSYYKKNRFLIFENILWYVWKLECASRLVMKWILSLEHWMPSYGWTATDGSSAPAFCSRYAAFGCAPGASAFLLRKHIIQTTPTISTPNSTATTTITMISHSGIVCFDTTWVVITSGGGSVDATEVWATWLLNLTIQVCTITCSS